MDEKKIKHILKNLDDLKKKLPQEMLDEEKKYFQLLKEELQDKKLEGEIENKKEKVKLPKNSLIQIEEDIDFLLNKIQILENEKMLILADQVNLKKKFENDASEIKKYGGKKIASQIIPSVDMLKTVLQTPTDNSEVNNYKIGFEMIVKQIDEGLMNAGVTMLTTKPGDEFDPLIHQAIEQVESLDVKSGNIVRVIKNGYKLYDHVIVHAVVQVAK